MAPSEFTNIVYMLQIIVCTGLIFIGGLSSCLSLWVIPLTAQLPPALLCKQFTQTFTWGGQYLLPSSRILGGLLNLTAILTSQLSNPREAKKWKTWAILFCVLIIIAPYEIYLIFPINDRVEEIGQEIAKGMGGEVYQMKELQKLLRMWQLRNIGRVVAPAVVGVIGFMNLVKR